MADATNWKRVFAKSWADVQDSIATAEITFAECDTGEPHTEALPKIGDPCPIKGTPAACIAIGFKIGSYQGSHRREIAVRYSTEKIVCLHGLKGMPIKVLVPRDRATSGADVLSLSKKNGAKWSDAAGSSDPTIEQVAQMFLACGTYETWAAYIDVKNAFNNIVDMTSCISLAQSQSQPGGNWLCTSAEVTEVIAPRAGVSIQKLIEGTATLQEFGPVALIKFQFAGKFAGPSNAGWNYLYREKDGVWMDTTPKIYPDVGKAVDFTDWVPSGDSRGS